MAYDSTTSKPTFKHDAFISYSQIPDKQLAIAIRKSLMELGARKHLLRFRALSIFRDETDLSGRGSLTQRIQYGIDNSRFLILLARPENAVPSTEEKVNWVEQELLYWLKSKQVTKESKTDIASDHNIIICVINGELKWHGDKFMSTQQNCLNPVLEDKISDPKWIEFRQINKRYTEHPSLASSILSMKDPDFLQKIAEISAFIQGKTVDELIAEDRRRQRMWSAILTFALLVLIGLTITSFVLFGVARKNQDIAETNQKKAEASQLEATRQKDTALANLKRFKIEEIQRNVRNGNVYYDAGEFCLAKQLFHNAKNTINDYPGDSILMKGKGELELKYLYVLKKCP